jgi:hypothetical protein
VERERERENESEREKEREREREKHLLPELPWRYTTQGDRATACPVLHRG